MDLDGSYQIAASPDSVWAALMNPDVLARCIPGAEGVEKLSDTEFSARATIKIGPVKARYAGKVTLDDLDPPNGCTLKGEGSGGVAGFAKGEAVVRLAPEGGGTRLSYSAKATVGGRLAQLGQRLIDGAAKSLADEFFAKFAAQLGEGTKTMAPAEAHSVPHAEPASHTVPARAGGDDLAPQFWVAGLIGVVVILLAIFGIVL